MLADRLHVGDEIPGRVLLELGMRRRLAAAALVEEDDAVGGGIVEARHGRVGAGARPAMDDEHRLAAGIAVFGDVDLVERRDLQPVRLVGLDRRKEHSAGFGHRLAREACLLGLAAWSRCDREF